MYRILLDTNVLIDYFARREPYFDDVLKLRIAEAFGDVELWACTRSFIDILYILHNAMPRERLVSMMLASLDFIKLSTPGGCDLSSCLENPWPDIENQMVACGAQRVKADYLVTRNVPDFERSAVPVRLPAQAVAELAEKGFSYAEVELG